MSSLLFEIGTEEIPAGYIRPALRSMEEHFREALSEKRLSATNVITTATPRRLTLFAEGLPEAQSDVETLVQGPPARIAFDANGKPTKAAIGFAAAQGAKVADVQLRETERGSYCCVVKREKGRPVAEVLPEILTDVARSIPFPKSMRWQKSPERFARPVRNVVAMLDDKCLPLRIFGLHAVRETPGHPFLAPAPVSLERADYHEYCARLKQAFVLVDMKDREKAIRDMLVEKFEAVVSANDRLTTRKIQNPKSNLSAAAEIQNAPSGDEGLPDEIVTGSLFDPELLAEVVMLVEWPSLVMGSFDEAFLSVPAPVLKAAMMEHQRYFPIPNAAGDLQPRFLTIANRTGDPSDAIREGNERVLSARLSDAKYFWEADARLTLAQRVESLSQIQFLAGLGTYKDKAHRLVQLVNWIAQKSGLKPDVKAHAERAALLCKSDLLTEMVGEFPSLQGTVGCLYARRESEPEAVAQAIGEHYQPKGAGDDLPASPAGKLVALAEKMDNLAGGFAIGLAPTGSQDPYALRRQAQAAIRLTEQLPDLRLDEMADKALALIASDNCRNAKDESTKSEIRNPKQIQNPTCPPGRKSKIQNEEARAVLVEFLKDRLYQLCLDRGAPHDIARAAMASGWANVGDLFERLRVLQALSARPEWQDLVILVERTHNIGKNAPAGEVDESALAQSEEKELWRVYKQNHDSIRALIEKRDYEAGALRFAQVFAAPVHLFFEKVFVNVDDARLRNNRLAMMKKINLLFSERIADLSQIVTGVIK